MAFFGSLIEAYKLLPLWAAILAVPPLAAMVAFASVAASAGIKYMLQGKLAPLVKPLWCRFVWRNEAHFQRHIRRCRCLGHDATSRHTVHFDLPANDGLQGRPPVLHRDDIVLKFDLVEIGDRAAVNLGGTIQTHLFEDRIFKADRLKIGNNCSIGNMAFILYDTEMETGAKLGPLSVLMKGERLPASTSWAGIPCEQVVTPTVQNFQNRISRILANTRAPAC